MNALLVTEPISRSRIGFLIDRGIDPQIAHVDLEMVKLKLRDGTEGKGWTESQCDDAEVEYKRFLTLNRRYGRSKIVPNVLMDTFWHYHILDTRAYHRDSELIFGGYFHHFPYFGMRGDEDKKRLVDAFERTKQLYEREFGESMVRAEQMSCWHDCEGRCWHACSNEDDDDEN